MKALRAIAGVLFIICIPTFLITTDLRLAANDVRLYQYGFDKYEVSAATGLDKDKLADVAEQMIAYFNSDEEFFETDLFNQRELAHLKDVKGLIRLGYYLQFASLAYIALYVAVNFALKRRAFWPVLGKYAIWGSGTTVALLAVLGLWAATDFDSLFLVFHYVSFSNDLWQLSPGDNMLLMFPEGFFNYAAMFVGAAAIVEAIIIAGVSWGFMKIRGKTLKEAALIESHADGDGITYLSDKKNNS